MSRNLVGDSMASMDSNLDAMGLIMSLLTQNPKNLVYVQPKNGLSAFTSNPTSTSICNTFSRDIRST